MDFSSGSAFLALDGLPRMDGMTDLRAKFAPGDRVSALPNTPWDDDLREFTEAELAYSKLHGHYGRVVDAIRAVLMLTLFMFDGRERTMDVPQVRHFGLAILPGTCMTMRLSISTNETAAHSLSR